MCNGAQQVGGIETEVPAFGITGHESNLERALAFDSDGQVNDATANPIVVTGPAQVVLWDGTALVTGNHPLVNGLSTLARVSGNGVDVVGPVLPATRAVQTGYGVRLTAATVLRAGRRSPGLPVTVQHRCRA